MRDLKVTLIQTILHWEDPEKNREMLSQKIASIHEATDLVVLPEMFTTGFTMNNKPVAESMKGKTVEWMRRMAKEKNCVITGSVIIEEKKKYYNRLVWMRPNGKYEIYDKRHLFRYAGEEKYYAPGKKKLIVEVNGWRICPMVCYDLRFPAWMRNRIKKQGSKVGFGYDVLVVVANWPERRNYPREALLLARAIENQGYVIGVNRVGDDGNGIHHSGDSVVIDPKGEIVSKARPDEEAILTVSLSRAVLEEWRKKFPAWMDADRFKIIP